VTESSNYKVLGAVTLVFTLLVDVTTVIFGRPGIGQRSPVGFAAFVVVSSLPFYALGVHFMRKARGS
jgi:hypothetical protein